MNIDFASADPSVVKSIRQRVLLNEWLRAAAKHQPLPLLRDFRPDAVADELADMMGFNVVGKGDAARLLITHEGLRLAATYGHAGLDPEQRTNRYLDQALDAERYARVITLYQACLSYRKPTYSISTVQDADGKDVSYERLLLPFGRGDHVEQIVGTYKSISIEGGFKIDNLMGLRPKAEPVILLRAIIDQVFGRGDADPADDIVEII